MDHVDIDSWLEEQRAQTCLFLKRATERKEEMQKDLELLDEIIKLRESNRDMREEIDVMRAGNDQLRAEISALELDKEDWERRMGEIDGRSETSDRTES